MTKRELVDAVVRRCRRGGVRLPRAVAKPIIDMALSVIAEVVCTGEAVELAGFGKFTVTTRKAKKGYDFTTGKTIDLPPKEVVVFSPYRGFRATRDQG